MLYKIAKYIFNNKKVREYLCQILTHEIAKNTKFTVQLRTLLEEQ
jgi:uncharacterized protein YlaI